MDIEIVNMHLIKPEHAYDIKVDRSTVYGNPYKISKTMTRENACNLFDYFMPDLVAPSQLQKLVDIYIKYGKIRLFCWCVPERCHGETYKKYIMEHVNDKKTT